MKTPLKTLLLVASPLAHSLLHAAPPQPPPPRQNVATDTVLNISDLGPGNGATFDHALIVVRGTITHNTYAPALIQATLNGKSLTLDREGHFAANVRLDPGKNDLTVRASTPNPRQQVTSISTFIDASMVYGSDATRANALRIFSGGRLKTSGDNLLPLNTAGLANANDAHICPDSDSFSRATSGPMKTSS